MTTRDKTTQGGKMPDDTDTKQEDEDTTPVDEPTVEEIVRELWVEYDKREKLTKGVYIPF